jgi:hypothetical protein
VSQRASGRLFGVYTAAQKKKLPWWGAFLWISMRRRDYAQLLVALFLVRENRAENFAHDRDLGHFRTADFGSRFNVFHVSSPLVATPENQNLVYNTSCPDNSLHTKLSEAAFSGPGGGFPSENTYGGGSSGIRKGAYPAGSQPFFRVIPPKKEAPLMGSILLNFRATERLQVTVVALFLGRENRAENLAHDRDLGHFRTADFGG